jgi:LysM repeat protein
MAFATPKHHLTDISSSWELNKILISSSCDNSDTETDQINEHIKSIASSSGVDERFILAIIMQESKGCVRVQSTNNGVQNTGLMQSHAGSGTCVGVTPCPSSMIKQMIEDGTTGTSAGDGLQQCYQAQSGSEVTKYYKAARTYNSGSIDSSGNLGQGIATHCYASDIANRVRGWAGGVTECVESAIGGLTSGTESSTSDSSDSGSDSGSDDTTSSTSTAAAQPSETAQPTETAQPQPTETPEPTESAAPTTTPAAAWTPQVHVQSAVSTATPSWITKSAPAATANAAPAASSTDAPLYPYASSSCQKYYTVLNGDICNAVSEMTGITFSQLRSLNAQLDENCDNLWLGYQYCIKA